MLLRRSLIDPATPLSRRVLRGTLLLLLIAACAYRVWLVVHFNPMSAIWSDPGRHWHNGTHPLDTAPLTAIDPIGYQIYIAILAKLTVFSPVLVAYWTSLLSLSGPWLWYRFLRELLPDRDWALAGWVVIAALPSWSAIYSYFMQETLLLPLLGAALWATWRSRRNADTASFVLAVAAWLLAGLTRGICLPLGAVAMAWLWFGQRSKFPKAILSLVLLVVILVPLAGRSWSLARMISPHGIGTMVQLYHRSGAQTMTIDFTRSGGRESWSYWFTSPAVLQKPFEPFSDWHTRREGKVHFSIDLDAGDRDWRAAMARLPPWDVSRAAWLTADNLVELFFGTTWPDTDRTRNIGQLNYWLRWVWAPLTVVWLVTLVGPGRHHTDRLLSALMLAWLIVQGLFPLSVNEGRYRKPFEGLLIAHILLVGARSRRTALGEPAISSAVVEAMSRDRDTVMIASAAARRR